MSRPVTSVEILGRLDGADGQRAKSRTVPREDRCWLRTDCNQKRLEKKLASRLLPAAQTMASDAEEKLPQIVSDFFTLYRNRPLDENSGGGRFNDSLCLYSSVRLLAPEFILESGTHRGHSSWILRQAAPAAQIISCDITHEHLQYQDPQTSYHLADWSEIELPHFDPKAALAWFDDHISHALRLKQAVERGFRQALFDDNFNVYNIYATGGVPVPTLAMLVEDELEYGERIEWSRHGKIYSYLHEKEQTFQAENYIQSYVRLPDLTELTRYSPASGMTYVRLRDA